MIMKEIHVLWWCFVCGAENVVESSECQSCECQKENCQRDNCSDLFHGTFLSSRAQDH